MWLPWGFCGQVLWGRRAAQHSLAGLYSHLHVCLYLWCCPQESRSALPSTLGLGWGDGAAATVSVGLAVGGLHRPACWRSISQRTRFTLFFLFLPVERFLFFFF